ncbi:MAG TPA: hypothetical protein VFI73_11600 [Candidatus Nitrosopolaris sp.]|nr:hypothetical protein [Candidatus Nitrosopolaris sp.]
MITGPAKVVGKRPSGCVEVTPKILITKYPQHNSLVIRESRIKTKPTEFTFWKNATSSGCICECR